MRAFMLELLPTVEEPKRELATDLVTGTLSAAGERYSREPRSPSEIKTYANAMTDMFDAYVAMLETHR